MNRDFNDPSPISPALRWTGIVISTLAVLFFAFDGVGKVMKIPQVIEATTKLGVPVEQVPGIGILLLVCTALYAIPQTSVLGAILLTGYLGGAVQTHVRVGGPAFPVAFSVGFGVLVWLGLWLRDRRLQTLVPLRKG